ncbi:TPA: von Willebrand factor binding protein Vwb [Staphylococcus aureus]|uniref:von Willebrand factor binding protein Vwb n=1 Tax=Staphylococcus aureus TaxID=1280 RepID=UPI00139BF8E9|nr:von Willebrand factor binding protein Vwb [Staphylococcus aureus]NDP83345.1 von Willebrand factor binding protein Vwb [Staphylococcus aureus]NDQ47776.1 von Willebrand factor binding protein Vwb [Staphylococcus aureus]NDQ71744.1 von Willebrand factor binding protein Vwb [Staphylococcus aureus]NDQ78900.1 von Willebrand factor binding protein Vwb [Staphylococcus aureus]HDG6046905.1 von Willebrand factor binding protein Vwb [Staphylococcus aureus]
MKNKLLVLSLGALCVSQIWESNRASAVVSGEENPYVSESLKLTGSKSTGVTPAMYKENLESLISSLSFADYEKYYEPEFKDVVKKYQQRFMAEDAALKKFFREEYFIKENKNSDEMLGITQERYKYIYDKLKSNNDEFMREIKEIKDSHPDLKEFDANQQHESDVKINDLENKVLMLGYAFKNESEARLNLYSKLDLILGYKSYERLYKKPTNSRMLKEKIEDLESIIDEFFEEINKERPKDIPVLSEYEHENKEKAITLKSDTEAAKNDESKRSKRSKRSLNTQNYKSASQEVTAEQKAEYERKAEERKEKFLAKNKDNPVVSLIDDEDDNENDKQIVVSAPSKKPTTPTTYTETTTQVPMPTVERQTQQQIIYNASKQLAGLNGESHDFSTTHQTPTTSNHTHNNVVEFEETSALPGRKSGSLVGISQIDSSHLTEREKRVIKREHVREAQKLVDNYKDTHSYKDRLNAQQKVNTLSEGHQKRFNKQINKVYNGK